MSATDADSREVAASLLELARPQLDENKYRDLCTDLNMDGHTQSAAWRLLQAMAEHFPKDLLANTEQDTLFICALYFTARGVKPFALDDSGRTPARAEPEPTAPSSELVASNGIIASSLIRSANVNMIDFLEQLNRFEMLCRRAGIMDEVTHEHAHKQVRQLQHRYTVMAAMHMKFEKLFQRVFGGNIDQHARSRLQQFVWLSFLVAKIPFSEQLQHNIVMHYAVLLCAVSHTCNVAKEQWLSVDFQPLSVYTTYGDTIPAEIGEQTLVQLANVLHFQDAKLLLFARQHFWQPFLDSCGQDGAGARFASNHLPCDLHALRNKYHVHSMTVADFDESLFLNGCPQIKTPSKAKRPVGHLAPPDTPARRRIHERLVGRSNEEWPLYSATGADIAAAAAPPTPIRAASARHLQLEDSLRDQSEEPTETLKGLLEAACDQAAKQEILSQLTKTVSQLSSVFINGESGSEQRSQADVAYRKNQASLSTKLFYRLVDLIIAEEREKTDPRRVVFLIRTPLFHRSLFGCCLLIVLHNSTTSLALHRTSIGLHTASVPSKKAENVDVVASAAKSQASTSSPVKIIVSNDGDAAQSPPQDRTVRCRLSFQDTAQYQQQPPKAKRKSLSPSSAHDNPVKRRRKNQSSTESSSPMEGLEPLDSQFDQSERISVISSSKDELTCSPARTPGRRLVLRAADSQEASPPGNTSTAHARTDPANALITPARLRVPSKQPNDHWYKAQSGHLDTLHLHTVLDTLKECNVTPFEFVKVIETVVRCGSAAALLSRQVVKFLNDVDRALTCRIAWREPSDLFDKIHQTSHVPSVAETTPGASLSDMRLQQRLEEASNAGGNHGSSSDVDKDGFRAPGPLKSEPATGNAAVNLFHQQQQVQHRSDLYFASPRPARRRLAVQGQAVPQPEKDELSSDNIEALQANLDRAMGTDTPSASSAAATAEAVEDQKRLPKSHSMVVFFRKLYRYSWESLENMCRVMEVDDAVKRQAWTTFEFCITTNSSIMTNRDADTILLCCLFAVQKLALEESRQLRFSDMVRQYESLTGDPSVCKRVFIARGTKSELLAHSLDTSKLRLEQVQSAGNVGQTGADAESAAKHADTAQNEDTTAFNALGDIITFYNTVFVPATKDFVMKFAVSTYDVAGRPKPATAPLSPARNHTHVRIHASPQRPGVASNSNGAPALTPMTRRLICFNDRPLSIVNLDLSGAGGAGATDGSQAESSPTKSTEKEQENSTPPQRAQSAPPQQSSPSEPTSSESDQSQTQTQSSRQQSSVAANGATSAQATGTAFPAAGDLESPPPKSNALRNRLRRLSNNAAM